MIDINMVFVLIFQSDKSHRDFQPCSYEQTRAETKFVLKMRLNIGSNRLISEVQEDFNKVFPYLKLEFFQHKIKLKEQPGFSLNRVLSSNKRIGDCQGKSMDGLLEINEGMKVSELEKSFRDQFGLYVRVFRHSGNLWLQTTMTNNWTLQKQNEHGRELSHAEKKPLIDEAAGDEVNYD
jgi:hypothetical protein